VLEIKEIVGAGNGCHSMELTVRVYLSFARSHSTLGKPDLSFIAWKSRLDPAVSGSLKHSSNYVAGAAVVGV
jgi:hypothetical protein